MCCYLLIEVRNGRGEELRNVREIVTKDTDYQGITDYQTTTEARGVEILRETVNQSFIIDYHHSLLRRTERESASADVALYYLLIGAELRCYVYKLYRRAYIDSKCFHSFQSFHNSSYCLAPKT